MIFSEIVLLITLIITGHNPMNIIPSYSDEIVTRGSTVLATTTKYGLN